MAAARSCGLSFVWGVDTRQGHHQFLKLTSRRMKLFSNIDAPIEAGLLATVDTLSPPIVLSQAGSISPGRLASLLVARISL
jgi:hypothetical protein